MKKISDIRTLSEISALVSNIGGFRDSFGQISAEMKQLLEQIDDLRKRQATIERELITLRDYAPGSVESSEAPSEERKNWAEVRDAWNKLKNQLEVVIDANEGARAELSGMRRNKYAEIIDGLVRLKLIQPIAAENLKAVETLYLKHRNGRAEIDGYAIDDLRARMKILHGFIGQ